VKTRCLASAGLAILCGLTAGFEFQGRVYKIDVRVFQIPPIQTVTAVGPDKDSNIVGTTMGGDVTTEFPGHPIVLQTNLALEAGDEEIKGILYDQKFLPRASCLLSGVHWTLAEHYSISCPERDWGTDAGRKEYHEPAIAPSSANHFMGRAEYRLTVLPVKVNEQEAVFSLKYIGFGKLLLDQDVSVVPEKIAIVGFPQHGREYKGPIPRGTVCILVLCIQREGI
jgi:hypothetical protein